MWKLGKLAAAVMAFKALKRTKKLIVEYRIKRSAKRNRRSLGRMNI